MRIITRGLLASALFFAVTLPAAAQEKATLRLNWLLYGFHTPFHLGVERGYYKAEGIDLEINDGKGSASTVQVVGAKGDTFGLSDGASIINGITKGAPIKAVMGIMNTTPFAIIVREDSGIKTLKDLEGKTISATAGEAAVGSSSDRLMDWSPSWNPGEPDGTHHRGVRGDPIHHWTVLPTGHCLYWLYAAPTDRVRPD